MNQGGRSLGDDLPASLPGVVTSITVRDLDWPFVTQVIVKVVASGCTPSGHVSLLVDGNLAGVKTLDATGKTAFAFVCLPLGAHIFVAQYLSPGSVDPTLPRYGQIQVAPFHYYGDIGSEAFPEGTREWRPLGSRNLGEGI